MKIMLVAVLASALCCGLLAGGPAMPKATAAELQAAPPKSPKAKRQTRPSWVKIQTPTRMKAAKKLRYRIFCRDACKLAVTTKLKWPGRPNLVTTIRGTFNAGESRANILTLNNPARNTLKALWRSTIMQVIVRARNLDTGAKRTVKKSVRFKR